MSYCADVKQTLAEKTLSQLDAPQKKNRLKPCCADAFLQAVSVMGRSTSLPSRLLCKLEKRRGEGFCRECDALFLRGAFLSTGSVADPQKRYHLEILLPCPEAKARLLCCLENSGLELKTAPRKDKEIFYLKSSEAIEDFLTLIGAQAKALEWMQTKVEKEVKNRINRINNSDNANLQRTVYFAGKVADAIAFLKQHDQFERLPEALKKTAALRRKYPGASLNELCRYSEEPITKSGLNHRLQKIVEEARLLEEELKNKEEHRE